MRLACTDRGQWNQRNREGGRRLAWRAGFLSVLIFGVTLAPPTATGALQVTIVDHQDSYSTTRGLGELLADMGQAYTDITERLAGGQAIDLAGCDVFVVGSFCTQNARLRKALGAAGEKMKAFVEGGGTIIVLSQADQDSEREGWVPGPARVGRGDADFDVVYRVQPKHPVFNVPEAISDAQLKGWQYGTSRSWPTSWESLSTFEGVGVLAGNDRVDATLACIVEAGWGKGRALFLSLAPDKARNIGNAQAKAQAPRLMRNLLAYAGEVRAGKAAPIAVFKGGWTGPIAGCVFRDLNGNGRREPDEPGVAGVGVSDTLDLVKTGEDGSYTLANTAGGARLVYICLPAGYSKASTWYHRLAADSPASAFDFPLRPADESKPFEFAQISDIHIGGSGTAELLSAALADIAALKDGPAFVLATGDLTNVGSILSHYDGYVEGISTSKIPVFSVFGNHDANDRGSSNYRRYLGPDYYSFDYGDCHFLIVNCVQKTPQQQAWIEKDMQLLRGSKRLFIFQHYSPSEEENTQFSSWSATAVFSGHWHSQHTIRIDKTTSYNTGTLLFGGIDCSPAGFKVIRVGPDGISSRMRWIADGKRLTIVTPAASLVIPEGDLLVVVNAYETTADTVSIRYELKAGGAAVAEGELKPQGDWNWQGSIPAEKISRGAYALEVVATNNKGEVSKAKTDFMVMAVRAPRKAPEAEWPQFGGRPERGGVAAAPLEPPLGPVWVRHSGGTFDFGSPVLKDRSLYLGIKDRGDFDRNGVLALRADSGEPAWFTPTPAAVSHSVAVDDKRVYACSHGGIVHAFERAGGKEVWKQTLGSPYLRWQYSGPVLVGDQLFAGTFAWFGAFKAEDGTPLWNQTYGGDWISSNACPAVKGDVVVVPANWGRKSLRAVRATTGETIWEFGSGGLHGSPVIAGNLVVFTTYGGTIHCVDLASGNEKWKHPLGGERSASTPAVASGTVVAGGAESIKAFRLDDGTPLWNVPVGSSPLKMAPYNNGFAALVGSPTIAGGIAYVPCGDGRLYALAIEDGRVRWQMDFGTPLLSAPCIVGDMMYVTAFDGGVYALAGQKGFSGRSD